MTVCPNCGKTNSDEARFCSTCGATLVQAPPIKVEVKSPLAGAVPKVPGVPGPASPILPRQVQRMGTCYYHAELPAAFVCSRCGRAICVSCNRAYGMLSFCPECYWGIAPKLGHPTEPYPGMYAPPPPEAGRPFF
jgi:membrane protease subunit (stomatin/prohibitin family)